MIKNWIYNTITGTVFILSAIDFTSWIVLHRDIFSLIWNPSPPLKLFTAFYFMIISSSLLIIKNKWKIRWLIPILNHILLAFCYMMLALQCWAIFHGLTLSEEGTILYNTPAIATVINFLFFSAYIRGRYPARRYTNIFPLIPIFLSSSLALVGYIFHEPAFYFSFQDGRFVGMNWLTSIFFFSMSGIRLLDFFLSQKSILDLCKSELEIIKKEHFT